MSRYNTLTENGLGKLIHNLSKIKTIGKYHKLATSCHCHIGQRSVEVGAVRIQVD